MRLFIITAALVLGAGAAHAAGACRGVDGLASEAPHESTRGACTVRMSAAGYPLPDPDCTPGAINPTLTADVLHRKGFTTKCVRDGASSAKAKAATYVWYSIAHPAHNTGKTQRCELDHLISLELGGADTLENIWPQCGDGKVLAKRWFKLKDAVENYLAREVRAGRMDLQTAQHGIATDWPQYMAVATKKKRK